MKIKIPKIIQMTTPLWSEKMLKRKSFYELEKPCEINGQVLNINRYNCCIVGETLGLLKKDYQKFAQKEIAKDPNINIDDIITSYHLNCVICTNFSESFSNIIQYDVHTENYAKDTEHTVKNLENELKKYSRHLKSKHNDIIRKHQIKKL